MQEDLLEQLFLFLRPPGRGVYVHTTGAHHAAPLLRRLYQTDDIAEATTAWRRTLRERLPQARILLLGIPSDSGAGMLRGSNFGPIGVRRAYLQRYGGYPPDVLDIGDVHCIPQLLHDDMLNDAHKRNVQQAVYHRTDPALPVSPLSVAERVFDILWCLRPDARLVHLGGDHGVTWPSMLGCHKRFGNDFGLLQLDAHDDLSEHRQGIKHCYSTWAYHTAKLLKPLHVVQIGIRNSERTKRAWRAQLGVQQYWIKEIERHASTIVAKVIKHFKTQNVRQVYISNDIDGTDPRYAPATGTPEPGGMTPKFVRNIIRAVCRHFHVIGGDVMEVAPALAAARDFAHDKTCRLGASYLDVLFQGILGDAAASR